MNVFLDISIDATASRPGPRNLSVRNLYNDFLLDKKATLLVCLASLRPYISTPTYSVELTLGAPFQD